MSNNNATVALPGHRNWDVWWSPESGFDNFQLDIVGFLAVLGESSSLVGHGECAGGSALKALLSPSFTTSTPSAASDFSPYDSDTKRGESYRRSLW
ncbi:uncharacterized protein RCC_03008 [Ramularia collo-cygni]|uniref:Uncharacterized protein n=1 Tax=Ramularia collo-cygni TaxID=112498 RepID=A0A2D3V0W6_9PEZI|nr:uncharacterized protein RCC_03008 [Ramularia collo-cygni]CZT17176.1 uncharacterized protein RCC_03008 [Ramularia collo-cygni]